MWKSTEALFSWLVSTIGSSSLSDVLHGHYVYRTAPITLSVQVHSCNMKSRWDPETSTFIDRSEVQRSNVFLLHSEAEERILLTLTVLLANASSSSEI